VPLSFTVEVNPSVTHELTFDANGGEVNPASKTVTYGLTCGTLPVPTRTGYSFDGWFTATSGGTAIDDTTMVTGDATCYAQWTVNNYTVTFNANGGTGVTPSVTKEYNTTIGVLPIPTRAGYTFDGWFTAASGGTEVSAATVVTGDAICYAQWTANNYTVTFNANGGTGGAPSVTKEYNTTIGVLPIPTRAGYTFDGWFTAASGGVLVTPVTVVIADVTYYARWTPIQQVTPPPPPPPSVGTSTDTNVVKVVLPKTKITKVAVGKRLAKISLKKVAKANKVTKYQLQYRVKGVKKWKAKNFTVKYTGATTAKVTVKKLKKGKRYQFRVRAWKTVGAKKYYAPWSAMKSSAKVK
jgi:uncharacterized repeat protein (TIGR02543 family)